MPNVIEATLSGKPVEVTLEERTKWQIALDRVFRAESRESRHVSLKDVPPFRDFKHAFKIISRGYDLSWAMGRPITNAQEAVAAGTWANLFSVSMTKALLAGYAEPYYGEMDIVRVRPGGVANFKTQEVERLGYFADLATADPESADFSETAPIADEKVSYTVIQKGNLLTITRKAQLADDVGAVPEAVRRLGRAARRTLAKYIWTFWTSNVTCEFDSVAWFHGSHANLQSVALSADLAGATEIVNAVIKLAKMVEPNSGERLGLRRLSEENLWLVVPVDLVGVGRALNASPLIANAGAVASNPCYGLFGADNSRIIANALLTDVTDWGVFRDPSAVACLELGFLAGQQEPVIYRAADPSTDQMFVADKLRYRVRHEYGADIVDYRGAVKAVVAG